MHIILGRPLSLPLRLGGVVVGRRRPLKPSLPKPIFSSSPSPPACFVLFLSFFLSPFYFAASSIICGPAAFLGLPLLPLFRIDTGTTYDPLDPWVPFLCPKFDASSFRHSCFVNILK